MAASACATQTDQAAYESRGLGTYLTRAWPPHQFRSWHGNFEIGQGRQHSFASLLGTPEISCFGLSYSQLEEVPG